MESRQLFNITVRGERQGRKKGQVYVHSKKEDRDTKERTPMKTEGQ